MGDKTFYKDNVEYNCNYIFYHPIRRTVSILEFRVIKENRMGSTDGSSTDYGSSDFDSDTGSRVSSMSATSANEEHFMIDHDPVQAGDTEVDLSAFHDVCRKILAKPLPPNASTGKTRIS